MLIMTDLFAKFIEAVHRSWFCAKGSRTGMVLTPWIPTRLAL